MELSETSSNHNVPENFDNFVLSTRRRTGLVFTAVVTILVLLKVCFSVFVPGAATYRDLSTIVELTMIPVLLFSTYSKAIQLSVWIQLVMMYVFGIYTFFDPNRSPVDVPLGMFILITFSVLIVVYGKTKVIQQAIFQILIFVPIINGAILEHQPIDYIVRMVLALGMGLYVLSWVVNLKISFIEETKESVQRENLLLERYATLGLSLNAISHDWKTEIELNRMLLKQITTSSSSINGGGQISEQIGLLVENTENMHGKISVLRAEFDKTSSHIEKFDLVKMLSTLRSLFAKNSNIPIYFSSTGQNFMVLDKPNAYLSIFENLLSNSIELKNVSEVAIRVEETAGGIEVSVENDGQPIQNCMNCRFEHRCLDQECKTFTLRKTTKATGSGTGMVSVLENIRLLGLGIEIASSNEKTKFRIMIPKEITS